uniref:FMRFamide-like neuropeptides 1 n=1 Tax=Panagrellus redivivus TaxID=6233 RepID=A0A7E4UX09_PANRE
MSLRSWHAVILGLLLGCVVQVFAKCCQPADQSAFCQSFEQLTLDEQREIQELLGDACDGNADEAIKSMEKRKPNFIRFGRSDPNFLRFGRAPAQNNFLRFGRTPQGQQNFLRFGKRSNEPNFLRFGREPSFLRLTKSADPNFLRFGKRAGSDPNFLRFGKSNNNNFLRFGRSPSDDNAFEREYRKPNFLRFG